MIEKSVPKFPLGRNQIKETYSDYSHKGSKHFVMWSGGTDSTLLLYELLDAYGAENVVAISYIYPWLLEHKIVSEIDHRELFKQKMKLKGIKYSNFTHVEIKVTQTDLQNSIYPNNGGLPQSVAWLFSIPLYAHRDSIIYDGGIRCDDLTLRLDSYKKVLDGLNGLLDKELTFRQPYLYYDKKDIIAKLFHYDIYDCTWHCEMPDGVNEECTTCIPCKTHMMGLQAIVTLQEYPEQIIWKAKDELNKIVEKIRAKNKRCEEYKEESICIDKED